MADDIPEEDLFADLYDADDTEIQAAPSNAAPVVPEPEPVAPSSLQPAAQNTMSVPTIAASSDLTMTNGNADAATNGHQSNFGKIDGGDDYRDDNYGPIGIKEDGYVCSNFIFHHALQTAAFSRNNARIKNL